MNNEIDKSGCISYLDLNAEIKRKYISEKNYEESMKNNVEPYVASYRKSGYIDGINNVKLYFEKYIIDNSKGNIVISHGFGEFCEKYTELIYYFLNESYSVFIMEHRGNARSSRLGKDKYQISVEHFDNYIEDLKTFIDEIVLPEAGDKKLFMFAHSMGGGIGTAFLEKYPEYFKAAVLSSPMHKINTGKYPQVVADAVSTFLVFVGMGKEYLPGQKPYTGNGKFPCRTTHSKNRWDYENKMKKENEAFQTGGSSAKWYYEAMKADEKMLLKENAGKVKVPVILFQAELDTHVMPEGHLKFAENAIDCEILIVKGSKHESFYEEDNIAFHVIDKILDFYTSI